MAEPPNSHRGARSRDSQFSASMFPASSGLNTILSTYMLSLLETGYPDAPAAEYQSSLADQPPTRHVLSSTGLALLKDHQFRVDEPVEICPINHTPFAPGDIITTLPCTHRFARSAIRRWLLEEKAECPVCRAALPFESRRTTPMLPLSSPPLPHVEQTTRTMPTPTFRRLIPRGTPNPAIAMGLRTRNLQRTIEDATSELRSLGVEPQIVPTWYPTTRPRINIRNRANPHVEPIATHTARPAANAELDRHSELLNSILAFALNTPY